MLLSALETVLQSFTSVLSTVLWMSLNSWWLAKLEAFQQGFQSHTVLVKQAFGLKYAEHSNTEHCAPQQSGLYHRTLSVTHPNHTKPKNRGCNVHIIIPNQCLDACSVIRSVKCNGTFGSWLCRPHVLQLSVQQGVPAEAVNVDLYWKQSRDLELNTFQSQCLWAVIHSWR